MSKMSGKVVMYIPGLMKKPEYVTEIPSEGDPVAKVFESKEQAANELAGSVLPEDLEAQYYWFIPDGGDLEKLFD